MSRSRWADCGSMGHTSTPAPFRRCATCWSRRRKGRPPSYTASTWWTHATAASSLPPAIRDSSRRKGSASIPGSSATATMATSMGQRCRRQRTTTFWPTCLRSDAMEDVMTDADALMIGWTQAQAATRRVAYRRLLGFTLIVQTAVGLIAVVVPVWLARKANLPGPPPSGWVQLWGVMLLIMATLYLPGCIEPVHVRWPNVVGIVARFVLAVAYVRLGQGLRWFGSMNWCSRWRWLGAIADCCAPNSCRGLSRIGTRSAPIPFGVAAFRQGPAAIR